MNSGDKRGADNHEFALAAVQNRRESGAEAKAVGVGKVLIDDDLVGPARLGRAAEPHVEQVQAGSPTSGSEMNCAVAGSGKFGISSSASLAIRASTAATPGISAI